MIFTAFWSIVWNCHLGFFITISGKQHANVNSIRLQEQFHESRSKLFYCLPTFSHEWKSREQCPDMEILSFTACTQVCFCDKLSNRKTNEHVAVMEEIKQLTQHIAHPPVPGAHNHFNQFGHMCSH